MGRSVRNSRVLKCALLVGLVAATACGKDKNNGTTNNGDTNNGATNNGATNNGATNNGATNNGATNNGATNNGATNNGATNNGTTNNGTTNNGTTNNGTTGYQPYDFTCPDVVTPAGTLDDIRDSFDVTDGCIGFDPFEPFYNLCRGAIATDFEETSFSGRLHILSDDFMVNAVTTSFTAQAFIPELCATPLGGGSCDGLADFMLNLGLSTAICVDQGNGDCLCDMTATITARAIGKLELTKPGVVQSTYFVAEGGAYTTSTDEIEFQTDGTTSIYQFNGDNTSSVTVSHSANDGDDCEVYCLGFMALCNGHDDVTGYADEAACIAACGGFAAGTPGDVSGDSLACRLYHLKVAADTSDAMNPDVHCVHAQQAPTAVCVP